MSAVGHTMRFSPTGKPIASFFKKKPTVTKRFWPGKSQVRHGKVVMGRLIDLPITTQNYVDAYYHSNAQCGIVKFV